MKSVLGEFSFGVSICRNKGTESDLGTLFCPGHPGTGVWGGLPPALGAWGSHGVNCHAFR